MQNKSNPILRIKAYNELMESIEYPVVLYDYLSCKQDGLTLILHLTCQDVTLYFRQEEDLLSVINNLENAIHLCQRIS
jgi:hypothetical protein